MTLRQLPSVHLLVERPELAAFTERHGRDAVVQAARSAIEAAREAVRGGGEPPDGAELARRVSRALGSRPALYRVVINATGVLLHTNLGRAPIADAAWQAMAAARGYCDLEIDLATGERASRQRDAGPLLASVTGAEAGLVVNNNAAAVLLALSALAGRAPTAISRGHLVEIGGGFRLPTIMEASGSPLMEIGTTNRTHLADYEQALSAGARLVLSVHRSNFVMTGYVSEPDPDALIALAHRHGALAALDLGSGALVDTAALGLPRETTVQEAVRQGWDAVCFSGDKLTGGPQAGYVVGRRDAVGRMAKHPLARAVRPDKLQLAAAAATLDLYRRGEAMAQIPILRQIEQDTLSRARAWREAVGAGEVVEAAGAVGGGSLPEGTLPGFALALEGEAPLLERLRCGTPSVVGHLERGRVLLHPRTVPPESDGDIVSAVRRALA